MQEYLEELDDVIAEAEVIEEEGPVGDRYPVPSDVLRRLPLVEARFVQKPIATEARVVLSSPAQEELRFPDYETALQQTERLFPLRAARLRDLLHRIEVTRRRFREVQSREEEIREMLNLRANDQNEKITKDLNELRIRWESDRQVLLVELSRLEEEWLETLAPHRDPIEEARREVDKVRVLSAAEADRSLQEAEESVFQAELEAIAQHQPAIEAAQSMRSQVRRAAAERIEKDTTDLVARAAELSEALLAEEDARRRELEKCREEEANRKRYRDEQQSEARREVARLTAEAGLLPGEGEADYRAVVRASTSMDAECLREGMLGEAGATNEKPWWKSVFLSVALLACGSIFGLSLGVLTGFLQVLNLAPGKLAVCCLLGTALFYLIGRLVHDAFAMASEAYTARQKHERQSGAPIYRWITLAVAFLIVCLVLWIEITVERQGVVRAIQGQDPIMRLRPGNTTPPPEWTYWCIAAIVAGPFVLFHAVEGWRAQRRRTLRQQQQALFEQIITDRLQQPCLKAVSAAVGLAREAERRYQTCEQDGNSPEAQVAARSLEEASRRRMEHPGPAEIQERIDSKQIRLEADLTVQHAEAELRAAQEALSGDPGVAVRRLRLEARRGAPVHSYTVAEAEQRLASLQQEMEGDPRVVVCRQRMERLRSELSSLDQQYHNASSKLEARRRPVLLSPSKIMRSRIQDAHDEWQAAQLLLDQEFERVRRILEAPNRLCLFLERMRDYYGDAVVRRIGYVAAVASLLLLAGIGATIATAAAVVFPRLL